MNISKTTDITDKRTVAIMQPYLFPNVPYFNLIDASDGFVFYDDVNFIKKGWINRNEILINGCRHKFAVPLHNSSQNSLIKDIKIDNLQRFYEKFRKQVIFAYKKAPFYEAGLQYIDKVFETNNTYIAELSIRSITEFLKLLGIDKSIYRSSERFQATSDYGRADRLIEIVKCLGATHYVNTMGGMRLYEKPYFKERGITLSFINPMIIEYKQVSASGFFERLSIIDALMNNSIEEILTMVKSYILV